MDNLEEMDRSSRQRINKETQTLNIRPNGPNSYLQDFPSKYRRLHCLLRCMWNTLQYRPHLGSQIKTQ